MRRAMLWSPTILPTCWKNSELCVALNATAKRKSAELPSRRRMLPLLLSLKDLSPVLKALTPLQVQPAHAQISGEVLLQCPLQHLPYALLLNHPCSRTLHPQAIPCVKGNG